MEFFTTKIVDYPVEDKINLDKLNKIFASIKLPEAFNGVQKVIIALVAREPNDYIFDTWRKNGKVYFTIPLIYEEVLNGSEEEVTEKCVKLFQEHSKDFK